MQQIAEGFREFSEDVEKNTLELMKNNDKNTKHAVDKTLFGIKILDMDITSQLETIRSHFNVIQRNLTSLTKKVGEYYWSINYAVFHEIYFSG